MDARQVQRFSAKTILYRVETFVPEFLSAGEMGLGQGNEMVNLYCYMDKAEMTCSE
jgi:hypothetical protein